MSVRFAVNSNVKLVRIRMQILHAIGRKFLVNFQLITDIVGAASVSIRSLNTPYVPVPINIGWVFQLLIKLLNIVEDCFEETSEKGNHAVSIKQQHLL